jgi:L-aspartate oxidase
LMWSYVGIVRSERRLKRALDRIVVIRQEIDDYWWNFKADQNILEVRNLSLIAWLTIRSAMARKESRGIHYMLDYPDASTTARDVVLH